MSSSSQLPHALAVGIPLHSRYEQQQWHSAPSVAPLLAFQHQHYLTQPSLPAQLVVTPSRPTGHGADTLAPLGLLAAVVQHAPAAFWCGLVSGGKVDSTVVPLLRLILHFIGSARHSDPMAPSLPQSQAQSRSVSDEHSVAGPFGPQQHSVSLPVGNISSAPPSPELFGFVRSSMNAGVLRTPLQLSGPALPVLGGSANSGLMPLMKEHRAGQDEAAYNMLLQGEGTSQPSLWCYLHVFLQNSTMRRLWDWL
jgi:hypothetical protein